MFETHTTFKHFIEFTNALTKTKFWVELDSIVCFQEVWELGEFSKTEMYLKNVDPSRVLVLQNGKEILRRMQSAVCRE